MKSLFEDFVEDVNGVKVVRLDGLTYIHDSVALLCYLPTRKEALQKVRERYPRLDANEISRESRRLMEDIQYQQILHQIGLRVHYVPVRDVREKCKQRALERVKTIVVTPEAADCVQPYASDKEIVMITQQPIQDVCLVQLDTSMHSRLIKFENYKFTHELEPDISNSFVDDKTSEFLFKSSGGYSKKYGKMHELFKKHFTSEHTYKVLLQELNKELTLEEIKRKQGLIQSFADTEIDRIKSLGEQIACLDKTATAIKELAAPMHGIMQHARGTTEYIYQYGYHFSDGESSLRDIRKALDGICVGEELTCIELPAELKLPDYRDANLAKVKRGIGDVLSKENPYGFSAFMGYAKRIIDRDPESFEELIELLKRSDDDTSLYDGVARFQHVASYMKRALSWIDAHRILALLTLEEGWSLPKMLPKESEMTDIKYGFYPFLRANQEKEDFFGVTLTKEPQVLNSSQIVKNPTHLDRDTRVELVSGSNMNGKTIYLMQVPTIQIFGQAGFPVPASEATLSMMDRVIVRLKRRGEVEHNESALGGEINELNDLLKTIEHDGRYTLVSLDEYLTSTNPREGEALLYGVINERLVPSGAKVLVTHHFPHLNELAEESSAVTSSGFIPDRDGEFVRMNYRKTPNVIHTESYGVQVAHQMGLPKDVIDSAKKRLEKY